MNVPTYATVIVRYEAEVHHVLQAFVYQGYQAMCAYMQGPLSLCIIIYVVLLGYGIMQRCQHG